MLVQYNILKELEHVFKAKKKMFTIENGLCNFTLRSQIADTNLCV